MPRVTVADVQDIIDIDSSVTDGMIMAFIQAANVFVSNVFSGDTVLGDSTLLEIERYIAAHFVSCRDPRIKEEWTEGAKVVYAGEFGKGLESTSYGQMALLLDTTGKLKRAGLRKAELGMIDYSTEA